MSAPGNVIVSRGGQPSMPSTFTLAPPPTPSRSIGRADVSISQCRSVPILSTTPCAPCMPLPPSGGGGGPITGTFNMWGVLYYDGSTVVSTQGAPIDGGLYVLAGAQGMGGPPVWHDLLREAHFWQAPQQFLPADPNRIATVWMVGSDGTLVPGPEPTAPGQTLVWTGTQMEWGQAASPEKSLIHNQTTPVSSYVLPHDFARLPVVSLL